MCLSRHKIRAMAFAFCPILWSSHLDTHEYPDRHAEHKFGVIQLSLDSLVHPGQSLGAIGVSLRHNERLFLNFHFYGWGHRKGFCRGFSG
jgi:hypothetical protein